MLRTTDQPSSIMMLASSNRPSTQSNSTDMTARVRMLGPTCLITWPALMMLPPLELGMTSSKNEPIMVECCASRKPKSTP